MRRHQEILSIQPHQYKEIHLQVHISCLKCHHNDFLEARFFPQNQQHIYIHTSILLLKRRTSTAQFVIPSSSSGPTLSKIPQEEWF